MPPLLESELMYAYSRVLLYRKHYSEPLSEPFLAFQYFRLGRSRLMLPQNRSESSYSPNYVLRYLFLLRHGTGCPFCSLWRWHSPDFALPPPTRKSTILLRNWGQRAEPETIQNQRKCCRGVDCIVGSCVFNLASPYPKASLIAGGAS